MTGANCLFLVFWIGLTILFCFLSNVNGEKIGEIKTRNEAVKNGVASWVIETQADGSPKTVFKWNKEK